MTSPLTMHITLAGPCPFLTTIHICQSRAPIIASVESATAFLAIECRGAQRLIRHSCLR